MSCNGLTLCALFTTLFAGSSEMVVPVARTTIIPSAEVVAPCMVSASDRAWMNLSVAAWHFTSRTITNIGAVKNLTAIFFNEHCVLTSDTAMTGLGVNGAKYKAVPTHDKVTLPDGAKIPIATTSFTKADAGESFFVMSLPSVWRQNNVDPGIFGLERLMTAVALHEASHVVQSSTYGRQVEAISKRCNLSEDFNDDSIQERFESNADFVQSVERESKLLFAAAAARTDKEARIFAIEARDLMRARRDRWFVNDDTCLSRIEDLWLSLEGSGQWAGYSYLIDPKGGAVSKQHAMNGFGLRGHWWTQNEGLAMALTLDRLDYDWKQQAFGGGSKTLTEMLDDAARTK